MDQQPQSTALQEAIEREVRHLIGDLHMKVIALHTMLAMAQQPQPAPQPNPQPAPKPTPPTPPEPEKPQPGARGNGSAHEVTS